MRRCVIVGAGDVMPGDLPEKRSGELWIAADGGERTLEAAGITPDLFIGDLDSGGTAPDGAEAIVLPTVKDDTDTAAAVKAGLARGYREFLILGGLGGRRLSHTLANLQLLTFIKRSGGSGTLLRGGTRVTLISAGETVTVTAKGGYFSLFAAGGEAVVSVSGAKYSGDGIKLSSGFPLGVSNEAGGTATVSVSRGDAYLAVEEQTDP